MNDIRRERARERAWCVCACLRAWGREIAFQHDLTSRLAIHNRPVFSVFGLKVIELQTKP